MFNEFNRIMKMGDKSADIFFYSVMIWTIGTMIAVILAFGTITLTLLAYAWLTTIVWKWLAGAIIGFGLAFLLRLFMGLKMTEKGL